MRWNNDGWYDVLVVVPGVVVRERDRQRDLVVAGRGDSRHPVGPEKALAAPVPRPIPVREPDRIPIRVPQPEPPPAPAGPPAPPDDGGWDPPGWLKPVGIGALAVGGAAACVFGGCEAAAVVGGGARSRPRDQERTDVKALDQVIRERIAPVMKEAGFSRKDRLFWLESPAGDRAFVAFSAFKLGQRDAEFFVDVAVLPLVYADFITRAGGSITAVGLWNARLPAPGPRPLALGDHWSFDAGDEAAADHLTEAIRGVLPKLVHLLDLDNLLAYVRNPSTRPQEIRIQPRDNAVTLLLAEKGPSAELDGRLSALEAADPANPLVGSIRERLAVR